MKRAEKRLEEEIPEVEVSQSRRTGGPELVGVKHGRRKLSPSGQQREQTLRKFLRDNAELYGLEQRDIAKLETVADYANPSGNMSWIIVAHRVKGKAVFRGELQAAFTAAGELVRVTGEIPAGVDDADATDAPIVTASQAIATAAASIGLNVSPGDLQLKSGDEKAQVFTGGPFADDTKAELIYFPLDIGAIELAWSITLWLDNVAYIVVVGAEEADVLYRKNITSEQTAPATYSYYNADSPAPLSPTTATPGSGIQGAAIPRELLTVVSEHPSNAAGWMADGANVTTGNNVDAGLDLVTPNGIDAGSRPTGIPFRVFDFPYNPGPGLGGAAQPPTLADYRKGEVVHMFVWSNRYHDRLYELGFTEAARNFQTNNFGRGGLGNDHVLAEGQDSSGTNNANFATPADGSSGRMQMFIFTGTDPDRTSALDNDILIHELTHGTSNRLHANGSGLNSTMSGGMGEGWSDFYARVLTAGADENPNGIYSAGGYATLGIVAGFTDNYYYGIRRFPYAVRTTLGPNGRPHNPLTFADIDGAQINVTDGAFPRGPIGSATAFQVHNIGEVWASALFEVRARIIGRLGFAAGNQRALQIVTDGMKLDPVNPTLLEGRNSILTADCAAFAGADEMDIWTGFAARGMGFSASAVSSASQTVVEAFDLPNLSMGAMTITGGSCDANDGIADPGETITLNIPVTNPFCASSATGVTVSVAGGGSVALGTLGPGQSMTASVSFPVPVGSCGLLLTPAVTITSNLGTVTRATSIQVGSAGPSSSPSSGNLAVVLNDNATVDIPIVVNEFGLIGDVNVKFRMNHTFDGDVELRLVHPDGTVILLSDNRGGAGDNFGSGSNDCSGTFAVFDDSAATSVTAGAAPFAGSFRPEQALSLLNGKDMNGTWILRVSDTAGGDVGLIGCAQVEVRRPVFFCCGVPGTPAIGATPPPVLTAESASPANGKPDPNETVTMEFRLRNNGSGATTNLVATLLPGGGILAPSAPQTYGVVSPTGPSIGRPFTFVVDAACGGNLTATLSLRDGTTNLGLLIYNIRVGGTASVSNPSAANAAPVTIPAPGSGTTPATAGAATPYPSPIEVSGLTGVVQTVTATIAGFSHTFPGDVDILLVSPSGRTVVLMSDVGGGTDAVNANVTFSDAGGAFGPAVVSGTFRPTNVGAGDAFPSPAPALPHGSTLASLAGDSPNGSWRLFVFDDAGGDRGTLSGGWSLNITTEIPACTDQPCTLSCPANITAGTAPGQAGNTVMLPATTLSGSCGVLSTSRASGSFFPIGTTVVTTTATRNDGVTTSCSYNVKVNDVEAPSITLASASPSVITDNNHKMVDVTINYTSSDNSGVSNVCALSVTSNEPVNEAGDGNTGPDWEIIDSQHVRLRAERSGTGTGRIYTITITCMDAAGNATSQSVQVTVPHDNRN